MNFDNILAGSFKDVRFLMTSGSVSGGNKNVVHSFPNSNRQTVENLGRTPRSFPVEIVLSSTDYAARRDRLLAALESPEPGPLIHPFHGRIENVIAGPYTLKEDFTNIGSGSISVTFYIDNGPGVPQQAGITASTVSSANDAACTASRANFGASFNVTPSYLGSFSAATAAVRDASTAFKQSQAPIDGASEYLNAADELSDDVAALILAPVNLALRITGMFAQADSLFDDPSNALKHFAGFFGYGGGVERVVPRTAAQLQAANNTDLFNNTMNVHALGFAYLSAVRISYTTVDEVDAVSELLEDQYKYSISNGIDSATYNALTDLRQLTVQLLDAAKLSARRVIEVTTRPTTARLLAFRYYGGDTQGEAVAALNGGNVSNLRGTVKVLTE